jgi:hypothetical protein
MAKVGDVLDRLESDNAYYDENDERQIDTGTYDAVIVALRYRTDVITKSGDVCDIYWPRYCISGDDPKFPLRLVRDSGLFRYRSPSSKTRNIYYKKFLDKLEIPLNQREIDGKIRYLLPPLTNDMVVEKKVVINVFTDEWSDGKGYHRIPVARLSKLRK